MIGALLTAQTLSLLGSRMTMVALPWLVLVTTGSPAATGLVGAAELLPYALACALGGPVIDRVGGRRVSIAADTLSVLAIGAVPFCYRAGLPVLVGLVAVAGMLRGLGDTAKRSALFTQAVRDSGMDLIRAAALVDGTSRAAGMAGAVLAGVLVVWLGGAANVLLIDAVTFGLCAILIGAFVRVPGRSTVEHEPYHRALAAGAGYLRRDRLVLGLMLMLFVTNMLDQGLMAVLIPLWAKDVFGSPLGIAAIGGATGAGAVLGNIGYTAIAPRLPRWAPFAIGFLIAGAPRYFLLSLGPSLGAVIAIGLISGLAASVLNPILSAVTYERIPEHLLARVQGLGGAIGFAGMPLGALLCGWLGGYGVRTALILTGAAYLLTTLAPFVGRMWRAMDSRPALAAGAEPRKNAVLGATRSGERASSARETPLPTESSPE
jgi:MFS family permease